MEEKLTMEIHERKFLVCRLTFNEKKEKQNKLQAVDQ